MGKIDELEDLLEDAFYSPRSEKRAQSAYAVLEVLPKLLAVVRAAVDLRTFHPKGERSLSIEEFTAWEDLNTAYWALYGGGENDNG